MSRWNVFLLEKGDLCGLFCICQDAGSRPSPLTTAHTYKEVSTCTPRSCHSHWGVSKATPVPSPPLTRRVPVSQAVQAGAHPAKGAAARQPQSRTGSARGVRGVLMFQEATGRHAQQGLLNDVTLPFSASPLVGLWYVKLHPCGARGPNLNTALGSSTIAWREEAGMALAYSTGCHTHSIPLDRMGLECRGREDLVMQNHSTSSIIKHLQISFPTEEHQVTQNPVRCAGEVDPQMVHGICQWLWS